MTPDDTAPSAGGTVTIEVHGAAGSWVGWHLHVDGRPARLGHRTPVPAGVVPVRLAYRGGWPQRLPLLHVDGTLTVSVDVPSGCHVTVRLPLEHLVHAVTSEHPHRDPALLEDARASH